MHENIYIYMNVIVNIVIVFIILTLKILDFFCCVCMWFQFFSTLNGNPTAHNNI